MTGITRDYNDGVSSYYLTRVAKAQQLRAALLSNRDRTGDDDRSSAIIISG